jgi:hypothetical protein
LKNATPEALHRFKPSLPFVQEAAVAKQELVSLQTAVDTLHEQFNLLQIEKETEVDSLTKQVIFFFC